MKILKFGSIVLSIVIVTTAMLKSRCIAQTVPEAGTSGIILQDSDIDGIKDAAALKHLLKAYAAAVRSNVGQQQQVTARLMETDLVKLHAVQLQSLAIGTVALILLDANDANRFAADKLSEAQEECRNLSTLQSAINGGLALNPASYGRTYLSVFGFLTPFLFKNCSTNTSFSPIKIMPDTLQLFRQEIHMLQNDVAK